MKYTEKKEDRVVKTFESFLGKGKWDNYENVSKSGDVSGEVDAATKAQILNIENFNEWLSTEYHNGEPGLVGRADKLSPAWVIQYFLDQGVECTEQEIMEFRNTISYEWRHGK